ncbi:cytochrome P450 [Schizopora paradoxa]|uniref:Cytochrome P450 n=1 Tax=Schizopora paradoxa TaxID=27342 RepID=A0A0H2S1E5_9AGAM|nr:cytochrome P450 [Schizopora paradoxa]
MNVFLTRLDCSDAAAAAGCGLLLWIAVDLYNKRKRASTLPLPPGPKPLPFIGNTLDMPRKDDRLTLTQWGQEYGELVLVTLLGGRKVIFINSAKAANELFEKRSRIYSDRPGYPLINDTVGVDWNFAFIPYGEAWRRQRKIFISEFGVRKVDGYVGIQERLTKQVLRRLLQNPDDFLNHLQLHSGNLIMQVIYNIRLDSVEDVHIQNIIKVLKVLSEASRPIAYLIDSIPIVRHMSYFWPGSLGKKSIAEMRNDTETMVNTPYDYVKAKMAQGDYEPSYVSNLLDAHGVEDVDEELVKKSAAVGYAAGSETSSASTSAFMLAMVNYPEVQERAHAEIKKVIGTERLPTVSDRSSLPYVYAIYKETLRWHTVVPQAVPRFLREDGEYNGYMLPAGCSVISNTWGIMHDPAIYPDPMEFKPERYFSSDGTLDFSSNDPEKFAFGYGRRICAGRHFAENSLWLYIAQTLATMKISHKLNNEGREIEVKLEPSSGLVSLPTPFQCSITPRSEDAVKLIMKD